MSMSFIGSNWHRRYPFSATASLTDTESGEQMPNQVIVACKVCYTLGNDLLYVARVTIGKGYFSLDFRKNESGLVLGTVQGRITEDNQVLKVRGLVPEFSGTVVVGDSQLVKNLEQVYNFDESSGALEASVVTVISPPNLSWIDCKGVEIRGDVEMAANGLNMVKDRDSISFSVQSRQAILSKKDRTASLLTCKNPVIGKINNVIPKKKKKVGENEDEEFAKKHNSISILGIAPVTVTADANGLIIGSSGFTLGRHTVGDDPEIADDQPQDLCKPELAAPEFDEDASEKGPEEYYGSLYNKEPDSVTHVIDLTDLEGQVVKPEWSTWPQFAEEEGEEEA